MNQSDLKYLELLAKNFPNVNAAAAEITRLQAILELPKTTEHFMSDIHGEYSYFTHILKNASGAIHSKIDDSFGDLLGEDEKNALALLLYYPERELARKDHTDSWYRVTIHRLVAVCRQATDKYTRAKVRSRLPEEFAYLIEELIDSDEHDSNKRRYFESIINNVIATGIADQFIAAMANLISRLTVDRLHICGDVFDRGPAAQLVMDDLLHRHGVDFVWGNHDVLWMGAAMGNPACIANALRNSLKYGNFDTLEDGYGVNVRPLAVFAVEQYADDPCTYFQPTYVTDFAGDDSEITAKILKAITVIQFKLEGQLIRNHPEYHMDDRLLLHLVDANTGTVEIGGKTYHVNDCHLPTVDKSDPYRLSPGEENVVSQLSISFRRSTLLQKHVDYLLEKGAMYRICNGNLLYHGCVPMEADGSFSQVTIGGQSCSGRELMDVCDRMVRTANYDRRDELTDFLWYLWCGPSSPLNGKDKIATFERTFLTESEAGVETKNAYYSLWNREETACAILREFGVDPEKGHIINGHVPVKKSKGEQPIKANGRFINIDGGMSKAYQPQTGICGFTLVFSSHELYLAEHQQFDIEKVGTQNVDMISRTIKIEQYPDRLRVRDTDGGEEVTERIADLEQLLAAYRSGVIRTPDRMG
ncbi:MAG: fructose-1,6-bisphosphatase [Oscillospiraceae bacterium]|nr:fructose-1,6-bisphosphatase [Oscillospiraceae bacterium]